MKKILFISSSRADYGLLRNVIFETKKNKKIKVFILVSGSHLSTQFGNTVKEIEKDGLKKNVIKKKILKKNFHENDISNYISETISATSNVLDKIKPELGYVEGNVAWISSRANRIKYNATKEEIIALAEWIKNQG